MRAINSSNGTSAFHPVASEMFCFDSCKSSNVMAVISVLGTMRSPSGCVRSALSVM